MDIGASRLRKFLSNERGNALPIMAAAIFPIIASIGAGVDIARAHMTKSKLQEAVDSAALAGRRVMSRDDIETAKPDARAYLGFNFPTGYNGTGPVTTTITRPSTGTVRVAARTTMPTTFMKLFGYYDYDISVVSEATQNFENVDVVLVLDTTGSMDQSIDGVKKITALRSAVNALYAELAPSQAQLEAQGLRMRFGIVPYSQTVNVGRELYRLNSSYIRAGDAQYYHWRYNGGWAQRDRTYNLANYAAGNTLGNVNGAGSNSGARWSGCIEERRTVSTITADDSRDGPPTEALDLNLDLIPNNDNGTKWQPYLQDPALGDPNAYCPTAVTPLKRMTATEIATAVNALVPAGSTYHDVGMIWGGRMISPLGLFSTTNPTQFNNRPVQRFIIFMTDGLMDTPTGSYSAYGIESHHQRVGASSTADNKGRHTKRFLMACNQAQVHASVWTIAFGTGHVQSLQDCATNDDQYATVADRDELIEKFVEIGKNIGPLRLSK